MKHRELLLGLIMTLLGGLLAGCNTTRGAGQDIEALGEAIEEEAEEEKGY